jgi:predicted dehydrogenase
VRELIAVGRIGELRLVVGHFSYTKRKSTDIRSRPEYGGGALFDIGCYPITLSRWLFGAEPTRVVAAVERDPETGVDRLTTGILEFARGQASFTCSGDMVAHQRLVAYGTTGRVELVVPYTPPNDRPSRVIVDDGRDAGGSPAEVVELEAADHYTRQGDQFSLAVRGSGTVPVPLEDAVANMAVIDALFRSAESGRWEAPASA